MSRRIGILTFSDGIQTRTSYVWDMKSLSHLRVYASYVKSWTSATITGLTWCESATVLYRATLPASERRDFVFFEDAHTDTSPIEGQSVESWPFEYVVRLYLRQDGYKTAPRSVGWPAPLTSIFDEDGQVNVSVGGVVTRMLEQCTGLASLSFSTGGLRAPSLLEEEKT